MLTSEEYNVPFNILSWWLREIAYFQVSQNENKTSFL